MVTSYESPSGVTGLSKARRLRCLEAQMGFVLLSVTDLITNHASKVRDINVSVPRVHHETRPTARHSPGYCSIFGQLSCSTLLQVSLPSIAQPRANRLMDSVCNHRQVTLSSFSGGMCPVSSQIASADMHAGPPLRHCALERPIFRTPMSMMGLYSFWRSCFQICRFDPRNVPPTMLKPVFSAHGVMLCWRGKVGGLHFYL